MRRAPSHAIDTPSRPIGGEGWGEGARPADEKATPSPSHACGVGPSLSRNAGEGLIVMSLPDQGRTCPVPRTRYL